MEINPIKFREWLGVKVEPMKKDVWSSGAQRGTVMIELTGNKAQALLVDDEGGVRESFSIAADLVDELIGAAARAWADRGSNGSFAVIANLRGRGDVAPRPIPTPGPGPIGDELLRAFATLAHHQLLGIKELAEMYGRLKQLG